MVEVKRFIQALKVVGADPAGILSADSAHVVAHGHQIISQQSIPGVQIIPHASEQGIAAKVIIEEGRQIAQPIHLCFGLFERSGVQNVTLELLMGANAKATLWSHCLFSDFSLVTGRVGMLDVDFDVVVGEDAVAEFTSKVFGHGTDRIRIKERLVLAGRNARGLIKSRVAVEDDATAEVIGITEGNAAGARGHVDCTEIIKDRGMVSASPVVKVTHPEAKVTHEAAIGSVDRQQMETLMARGLTPEEAVHRIVGGLLR